MMNFNTKKNIVYKLSPSVLSRYEANISKGIIFLYNVDYDSFWTGNFDSYIVIKLIDGKRKRDEIINIISQNYQVDKKDIVYGVQNLIDMLEDKNFIEKVQ